MLVTRRIQNKVANLATLTKQIQNQQFYKDGSLDIHVLELDQMSRGVNIFYRLATPVMSSFSRSDKRRNPKSKSVFKEQPTICMKHGEQGLY
jgi:hypothetical protein